MNSIKIKNCTQCIHCVIESQPTDILRSHIPNPTEDWEFKILSIFTTKSVEELRSCQN